MSEGRNDNALLITGAGIGGLSAAIALARSGETIRVLERSAGLPREGAGIQLGANATRILRDWGVLEALAPNTVFAEGIRLGDGVTGEALAEVRLGQYAQRRYGAPYILAHRADLQQALLERAKAFSNVEIMTGREVTGFEQKTGLVMARTPEGALQGRAMIGADGLWSALRKRIDPGAAMVSIGKAAWRGWLEPEALPRGLEGPWTGLWMSRSAHLVHYPVRGGSLINVVAIVAENWPQQGWEREADAAHLLPCFEHWDPRLKGLVGSVGHWRKWSLYDVPPLLTWTHGLVTLLGDAAHPVPPFLAQGAALAIEDADLLGRLLGRPDIDVWEAFRRYESARLARTARMRFESRRMGRIYHMDGLLRRARDFVLRRRSPEGLLRRFDWLYGFSGEES